MKSALGSTPAQRQQVFQIALRKFKTRRIVLKFH